MADKITIPKALLDASIAHQVNLGRYTNGTVTDIIGLLNGMDQDLVELIRKRGSTANFTTARLEKLLSETKELIKEGYSTLEGKTTDHLTDLATHEAEWSGGLLGKMTFGQLVVTTPSAERLAALVTDEPLQGALLGEWFGKLAVDKQHAVSQAIRIGTGEGEAIESIVTRLTGTKAQAYADGILEIGRRNTEAVVRTAVNHTSNNAQQLLLKQNEDMMQGWTFVATLDGRTSLICASLSGTKWPVGEGPIPPRHFRCRSFTMPLLKTWKQLGIDIDEMPPGERAAVGGPVNADISFSDWLKTQKNSVQDDILGKTRGELFRNGGLSVDKFADKFGNVLSLDELAKKEAQTVAKIFPDGMSGSGGGHLGKAAPVSGPMDFSHVLSPVMTQDAMAVESASDERARARAESSRLSRLRKKEREAGLPPGLLSPPSLAPSPAASAAAKTEFASTKDAVASLKANGIKSVEFGGFTGDRQYEVTKALATELDRIRREFPELAKVLADNPLKSLKLVDVPKLEGALGELPSGVQAYGWYHPLKGRIGMATERALVSSEATPGGWVIHKDGLGTFRHELGHHMMPHDAMLPELQTLFADMKAEGSIKKFVSAYADTSFKELWAESSSYYTSAKYKAGSLPAKLEALLEERYGKRVIDAAKTKLIDEEAAAILAARREAVAAFLDEHYVGGSGTGFKIGADLVKFGELSAGLSADELKMAMAGARGKAEAKKVAAEATAKKWKAYKPQIKSKLLKGETLTAAETRMLAELDAAEHDAFMAMIDEAKLKKATEMAAAAEKAATAERIAAEKVAKEAAEKAAKEAAEKAAEKAAREASAVELHRRTIDEIETALLGDKELPSTLGDYFKHVLTADERAAIIGKIDAAKAATKTAVDKATETAVTLTKEELKKKSDTLWAIRKRMIEGKELSPALKSYWDALPEADRAATLARVKAETASTLAVPKTTAEAIARADIKTVLPDRGELRLEDFTKHGEKLGSNDGGLFIHKLTGEKWYMKFPDEVMNAKNELLANHMYRMLGIEVPETIVVRGIDGRMGIASKWVDGIIKGSAEELAKAAGAMDGFVADAWLANWDVVGANYDNLLLFNGRAIRIDSGGSLLYRAKNGLKGSKFGETVSELSTLRDRGLNPQSESVFKHITNDQLTDSAKRVLQLRDEDIRAVVMKHGPYETEAENKKLADLLLKRKADVARQFPEAAPGFVPPRAVVKLVSTEADLAFKWAKPLAPATPELRAEAGAIIKSTVAKDAILADYFAMDVEFKSAGEWTVTATRADGTTKVLAVKAYDDGTILYKLDRTYGGPTTVPTGTPQYIKDWDRSYGHRIKEFASANNMTESEYIQAVEKYGKKLVEAADCWIDVPANLIPQIESSKFMGQVEIKAVQGKAVGNGMVNPRARQEFEQKSFGVAANAKPQDYPFYGFITDSKVGDYGGHYGGSSSVRLRFKSYVKDQATFTTGDSLSSGIPPSALNEPSHRTLMQYGVDPLKKKQSMEAWGKTHGYMEVQYYGHRTIADVEEMIFHGRHTITTQNRAIIEKHKIKFKVLEGGQVVESGNY